MSMAQTKQWRAKSQRPVGSRLGRGSSPLRVTVANAVQVRAIANGDGASVEIYLTEGQLPERVDWFLPYITGRRKRLRHPFMKKWRHAVQATGDLDVWWPTLRKHIRDFARARDRAVADVERYLGS